MKITHSSLTISTSPLDSPKIYSRVWSCLSLRVMAGKAWVRSKSAYLFSKSSRKCPLTYLKTFWTLSERSKAKICTLLASLNLIWMGLSALCEANSSLCSLNSLSLSCWYWLSY